MRDFPNAFVITGSIGSGKSTACNFLKLYGFSLIDADLISHEILKIHANEIAEIFGAQILTDGEISREKLGKIVFNDKKKLEILENFLHPKIRAEIFKRAQILENQKMPYFVDIPLFFEKKNYAEFKKVVLIYAPRQTLIKRVMQRNSLDFEAAKNRVDLQMDIEKKREMANFIIDNSTDLRGLESEILNFMKGLKNEYKNLKI